MFNKKGQSILENVITVTLVSLAIVLSWDLSSQLTGGGIKNLVSWLEEPDPHKYLIQAPPGGGISIPGCDCDPWNPPLTSPGICDSTGTYCGDVRKGYHIRNCYPPGCENTVQPNIPTKICEFQNNCCTPWNLVGVCGVNQLCPSPVNCYLDGRCNDGTGLGQRECGNGNFQQQCQAFPACNYHCNLNPRPPDPNGKDTNASWCTPSPSGFDHRRLPAQNIAVTLLNNQAACSTSAASCNPSSSNPSNRCCRSYCNPPLYARDPATNTCVPCLQSYSQSASKAMNCERGGGRYADSCGNYNYIQSIDHTCDHGPYQRPGVWTMGSLMYVDSYCTAGYEAIGGYCHWYNAENRDAPGRSLPDYHPAATGGTKVCCPFGVECGQDTAHGGNHYAIYPAPCLPGDTEGWRCEGVVADCGNGVGEQIRLYTTTHCVPKISTCPGRATFFCDAFSRNSNQSYRTCSGNPPGFGPPNNNQNDSKYHNYQFTQFCTGDCSGVESRITWCCNQPNTWGCQAYSNPSHSPRSGPRSAPNQPYPNCSNYGKQLWFQFIMSEYDDIGMTLPSEDSLVSVCCSPGQRPTTSCVALHARRGVLGFTAGGPSQFKECRNVLGNGWYELMRFCSGGDYHCRWDRHKITICCQP